MTLSDPPPTLASLAREPNKHRPEFQRIGARGSDDAVCPREAQPRIFVETRLIKEDTIISCRE
jgi:hypothetical protein